MNRNLRSSVLAFALSLAAAGGLAGAQQKPEAGAATAAETLHVNAPGQFFLISSINASQNQLVLKRPTEVTQLARVSGKTGYFDDQGKPLKLTDLRAGDTVYVVLQSSGTADPLATRIQQGPMTVDQLHRSYVEF
jgi:hypothetical protein